ncbi:maltokinase N-terminal cap-like domain-containing protein [Herbiconiux daphne]|uniref:Maltokinase n=1 Tax=Herbiconiux daphne TaxID=2970914 RepID=A0ABT2H7F8_9MICO|nr:phosphotransferase [Herbiconiux daphne]MCS5735876.1 phosphotransferase [Herbiconiux daphne]
MSVSAARIAPTREVRPALADWIRQQRWFASSTEHPVLSRVGMWSLVDHRHQVGLETHLILDESGVTPVLYQVPLSFRSSALLGGDRALIERATVDGKTVYVYDAPHDPAYTRALLGLMLDEEIEPGESFEAAEAEGHHALTSSDIRVTDSHVLRGEQSNTSIIYDLVHPNGKPAQPVICKVFRAVSDGVNPDVTVQSALSDAGSRLVPRAVGNVTGVWRDPRQLTGLARGHLAFAQEFIPEVEDAWRVALRAADAGESFAQHARSLGEATAQVHSELARLFPVREATPDDVATIMASMRERSAQAVNEVAVLANEHDAVEQVFRLAEAADWPPFQRIHGDYHLGQVLAVPGRGWVLLDFEGEPLRPLAERSEPDVTLRDVAGMLRSFDYVAGTYASSPNAAAVQEWAQVSRDAFLDGYIARSGRDLRVQQALLDAFELDKALYEVSYEARNRPDWLPIPVNAIRHLAHRDHSSVDA